MILYERRHEKSVSGVENDKKKKLNTKWLEVVFFVVVGTLYTNRVASNIIFLNKRFYNFHNIEFKLFL